MNDQARQDSLLTALHQGPCFLAVCMRRCSLERMLSLTLAAVGRAGKGALPVAFFLAVCCSGQRVHSGPITIDGQSDTVIRNVWVTSTSGDCIRITNSKNITVENSEIGPCGTASGTTSGNGIRLKNDDGVYIYDNYIHPETLTAKCCDFHDGIHGSNNKNVTIQGNVIAYGESNIEFTEGNSSLTVVGNFLLNPRGPEPRGQNLQCWGADANQPCSGIVVQNNYALSSLDKTKYLYPEDQEDSINFGNANLVTVQNNYITGGHHKSGCGLIADAAANNVQFDSNLLLNTGQCGIAIAGGTNQVVSNNKIYNSTPVPKGGNTSIYTWKQYSGACGPTTISGNVGDMVFPDGHHNAYWDGGGCGATLSGNTLGPAADPLLTPVSAVFPTPLVPPKPKTCVATSPYTTNTTAASGLPLCSRSK